VGPRVGLDVCEKSHPLWNSIPDRPARSQSLYRRSYPAHTDHKVTNKLAINICEKDILQIREDKKNLYR
jgi:hypothetical protein